MTTPALPDRLVLFDGECGMCDGLVQWLLAHDPGGRFRFAPLQGATAQALRVRFPEMPRDIDTVLYLEGGQLFQRSAAAFAIAAQLRAPWSWFRAFGLLPRALTDLGYRLVARFRYRVWGKLDACRVPTLGERARFFP